MKTVTPIERRIHQAALRLFAEKGASQVSVSDLARETGMSRGTIKTHVDSMERLFESVATELSLEMHFRVKCSIEHLEDPARRLANGIRFFVRRTHEEPQWGAFLSRFALNSEALRGTFSSQAATDVLDGLTTGRYQFRQDQLLIVTSMITSSVVGAMMLVMEGHKTWREAGSDTAEMILRALGIPSNEAFTLAAGELPPLPIYRSH